MPLVLRPPVADAGLVVAAYALILVVPLVFLRLVLGRRPFARLPEHTVPRFLALGATSAFLAVLANTLLDVTGLTNRVLGGVGEGMPFLRALFVSFMLAGLVEEGAKLLLLRVGLSACPDRATLLVAGLLVGVGFGIVENVANVYRAGVEGGPGALYVGLVRSFVLLHPVATALAADGLGRRVFGPPRWRGALWRGLGLAVLIHGVWDLVVFWQPEGFWIQQAITFTWLIWWGSRTVSDRVLILSGRDPARAAARRPPWLGATLVAFGLLHGWMITEGLLVLAQRPEVSGAVSLYGLELGPEAAPVLSLYNVTLSVAGLAGVVALGFRRRWGAALYAAGAGTGVAAEVAMILLAAVRGVLRLDVGELSDDLVAAGSAALLLWGTRRPQAPRRAASAPAAPTRAPVGGSAASAVAPGR